MRYLFISILLSMVACGYSENELNTETANMQNMNFFQEIPSLETKKATQEPFSTAQLNILSETCPVFQKAKECFVSAGILRAAYCASKWQDPSRSARAKLLESGLMSQEEYDTSKAEYNKRKKECKDKSNGSINKRFKCFKPVAIAYMDYIIQRFDCEKVIAEDNSA